MFVAHLSRDQAAAVARSLLTPSHAVLVSLWLSVTWLAFGATGHASDWPQFLGPTRDGIYTGSDLAVSWSKEGPPRRWQRKVGQGFCGPVVAYDKLILFHRLDDKEKVECLNPTNGNVLWSFDYPSHYRDDFGFDEGPRATPAIADGKVFTFGAEGALHCLELTTGKKTWSLDTQNQFNASKGFFGMACSPLIEGEAVLLNIGGHDGAGIVAFDKTTGKLLWKATGHEASYSSPASAAINGKRRAFFFTRNGLVALNPSDGTVFFDFPWRPSIQASVNAATPLIIDDLIFISTSYGKGAALLRFHEKQPDKVWSGDDILSNHYATSVHHSGFLYGFDGRQEHGCNLRCVELKTGKVHWSEDGFGAGTLILANDQLLVLTEKGQLVRAPATPEGFKPNARAQILPFTVRAHPALANGLFYARSKDQLVCVDLSTKL